MSVYDLVIKNAQVVDGSGSFARTGDVYLQGDRIASMQWSDESCDSTAREHRMARREVDARGRILCPGFIDVHSHDDFAALVDPLVPFKTLQGVTTEIVGNCGIGAAPFPGAEDWFEKLHPGLEIPAYRDYRGYFQALDDSPAALNMAVLAGHGALRRAAAPDSTGPLAPREMAELERALDEALDAGVLGMSAGLIYEPGLHAGRAELIRLGRALAAHAPLFTVHLRSEADRLLEAVEEAILVAESAGIGLQLSHHKAHGRNNWGKVEQSLALVDAAAARGTDVWLDQYPYAAGSTILKAVVERGGLSGGPALGVVLPDDIVVASCPLRPELEGRSVREISEGWGVEPGFAAERILELDPGTWVVVHAMHEADVETVMVHPRTMFGSDGLPTRGGRPHPRLYGTFPRILGHYVRARGLFSLERAIHKMTGLPAERFRLHGRGLIREGFFADLVLFDPNDIDAGSTYDDPTRPPVGIEVVWVNGEEVVREGRHTGARPGRTLRR